MRLLIMGPPGSGKGTQAVHIARELDVVAISTGDLFRAHVNDRTPLGRIADEYMDAGEYVPDRITNAMVRDRLSQEDCESGFLLDGYPRTLDQVEELDGILDQNGAVLDAVIELVVDERILVERLLLRARTEGRADDTRQVIRRRQQIYREQTSPLTARYSERGLLHTVDGDEPVDTVTARMAEVLTQAVGRAH